MSKHDSYTRSLHLSTSLHFDTIADYRAAGNGNPVLLGQTATGVDNGYGLQGNPTAHGLQDAVSRLENGTKTLLYPSGSTALNALEVFLNNGDHWLMPDSVYFPVRRYANYLKDHYDITYDLYNPNDLSTLESLITPQTKLIHIETPSSVTFDVTDVAYVVKTAHKHNILTSADNTWASGVLFKPLDHGVNISVLSLTKYASGYSDVFMGSITTKNDSVYEQLAYHHRVNGYTVSPFSAGLVKRGLESLTVRLDAEGKNALKLIAAIKNNPQVTNIYYIDTAKAKDFTAPNSLFSVELERTYNDEELERMLAGLQTFKIGESWGGTRSLILPFQPDEFTIRFNPPQNTILRFHSGLEDIADQLKDVESIFNPLAE